MTLNGYGQNLVPNPSFEDTAYCVSGPTQVQAALGWESYADSPDYFNPCTSNSDVSVPNNWGGINNQQAEMLIVLWQHTLAVVFLMVGNLLEEVCQFHSLWV